MKLKHPNARASKKSDRYAEAWRAVKKEVKWRCLLSDQGVTVMQGALNETIKCLTERKDIYNLTKRFRRKISPVQAEHLLEGDHRDDGVDESFEAGGTDDLLVSYFM